MSSKANLDDGHMAPSSDEEDLSQFSLGALDLTTEGDINFDEIDADLKRFQEDEMVQASLSRGVDLRQYARQTEQDLRVLAKDSIVDYMDRVEDVALLNQEIDVCDKTLERMQQMLQTFQSRLGEISDDIKHLQDDSLNMNVKLRNRRAVEARLQTFLEGVVVPPKLIVGICDNEVNEAFIGNLTSLNDKLKFVSSGDQPKRIKSQDYTPENFSRKRRDSASTSSDGKDGEEDTFTFGVAARNTKAAREVIPVLEMLRSKAVAKVRDFLLSRITALRKGKTNVQMTQQMLLKFRYLYEFLVEHASSVAQEIRSLYISAMSKVLLALFKSYHSQLGRLTLRLDDKKSLMAVVPSAGKVGKAFGTRAISSSRVAGSTTGAQGERKTNSSGGSEMSAGGGKQRSENKFAVLDPVLGVFALNKREEILEDLDAQPIVMHIAQKEGRKYPYEHIFRSVQKHLADSAANDFTFLIDFFGTRTHDLFNQIYSKTLSLCLESLEQFLATTLDSIALLLLIRINRHLRKVMQRRCCPCLDPYLDRIDLLLWPRIKVILDKNVASLANGSPGKLGPLEFNVHFVTKRYAHFSISVNFLHQPGSQFGGMTDASFMDNVTGLRTKMLQTLEKLAGLHQNKKAKSMEQFSARNIKCDDGEHFETLLSQQKDQFVEEELAESFGRLVKFVPESEAQLGIQGSNQGEEDEDAEGVEKTKQRSKEETEAAVERIGIDKAQIGALVRHFASSWKAGISHMAKSINTYFQDVKNSMEILKLCLTQLLLYHTRFQEIINRVYANKPVPFEKERVPIQSLFFEIRKYSQ